MQLERSEAAAIAEARKTLESADLDPSVLKAFDEAKTAKAKFDLVMDLMRTKTADLENMTRALRPP